MEILLDAKRLLQMFVSARKSLLSRTLSITSNLKVVEVECRLAVNCRYERHIKTNIYHRNYKRSMRKHRIILGSYFCRTYYSFRIYDILMIL